MIKSIPDGVWPTMITPYDSHGKIDYPTLEQMIEWYIRQKVNGLFAVCQSSEMFFLSLEERVALAEFVVNRVRGRIPVIASGHVSAKKEDQLTELKAMAGTGIDALVLISSRLADAHESEAAVKKWTEQILVEIPDMPMGIYECPMPYKRVVSPELAMWLAQTGRFIFLKDTCRDPELIKRKIEATRFAGMKIYNANAASFLQTLRDGAAGYSGVMANFHPRLYVWMMDNWKTDTRAESMQAFLSLASAIEYQYYPVNAKYYQSLCRIPISLSSRSRSPEGFDISHRLEIEALYSLTRQLAETYPEIADAEE